MANENKEIADIVKKCKILLLDIEGTTTSISFVKDKLFPYAEENVKNFLDSQWENGDVKDAVTALRKLAIEDQESSVNGVVVIPGEDATKEEQIEGLVKSVKWQMSADRKAGPLKQLQGLIWKQGYDNGDIKGHVYDDVSAALDAWHSSEGQKVYIYSSGSVQAQKLLFGQSLAGDLLKYIDGHFDTAVGAKQEPASYKNIVEKIGCQADEILFLTDIVKEAEAARTAGLNAALVAREGNAPLPEEATSTFPVLRSLTELTVSNKRKPEPQEETPAAKIPKTEDEVKTVPEMETVSSETTEKEMTTEKEAKEIPSSETTEKETVSSEATATETEKLEKMEVEETVTEAPKPVPVKEQVIVEEVTDSSEGSSIASVIDVEPVVEENEEKKKKTEKPQTDVKEAVEEKEGEVDAPVAEETPPAVVTEVEEMSVDQPLPDMAEVIEDVVPIVEEPETSEDMEELKNVGEVLEKECDEILSKVNSVTNLDNITVKPLLDPVPEETMETDNNDTSDIVERILDSELDMEMKQCDDIDLSTVSEMTDEKTEVTEDEVKKLESVKTDLENKKEAENETKNASSIETLEESATDSVEVETVKEKTENVEKVTESPMETKPQDTKTKDPLLADEQITESEKKEAEVDVGSTEAHATKDVKENIVEETNENIANEVAMGEKPVAVEEVVEKEPAVEEAKAVEAPPESPKTEEPQLNGKATNGDTKAVINGDANKDEELSARLSEGAVENGSGKVNGSNSEAAATQGQGDCKMEEIKVKTVADEPRTDPIEQPSEA